MKDREKQIDEIAKLICAYPQCVHYNIIGECEKADCQTTYIAEHLYKSDYRKQIESEWHYNPDGLDWGLGAWQCSLCGCTNHNLPCEKNINPLQWAGSKYCPNCGAKMKGE